MKKIVHYLKSPQNVINLGVAAFVKPVDHPDFKRVSNENFVITSRVIKINSDGFETMNSIYKEKS